MKVYRGPLTGRKWKQTSTKQPREYIKDWKPGEIIRFNATIDGVQRFTEVGIQIDEEDVLALFEAFLKCYRQQQPELLAEVASSRSDLRKLRTAIHQMHRLIAYKTPSEETLEDLRTIARNARGW